MSKHCVVALLSILFWAGWDWGEPARNAVWMSALMRDSAFLLKYAVLLITTLLYFRDGVDNEAQDDLSRRWKSEADTVVIGGGIAGCSVAYHLAKMVGSRNICSFVEWESLRFKNYYHLLV